MKVLYISGAGAGTGDAARATETQCGSFTPKKKRGRVISQSEFSENSLFEMTLCIVTGASAHKGVCAVLPLRYRGQYTGASRGARPMESIL